MTDMSPLSTEIDRLLAGLGLAAVTTFDQLVADWEAVAGEVFAAHADPVLLKDGELVVEAEAGSIPILRYAVSDLQRRLDDRLGPAVVEAIRIRPRARKG